MKPFSIFASCTSVRPMADKGWKLAFHTQEVLPPQQGELDQRTILCDTQHLFGELSFIPQDSEKELKKVIDTEAGELPMSQRIRNKIYRLWKAESPQVDFDSYYNMEGEKILYYLDKKVDKAEAEK